MGNNGEGSDFARSQRQQAILLALWLRSSSWRVRLSPWSLYAVAADVARSVDTDLEPWQMASLARLLRAVDIERLPSIVLTDVLEPVHDDEGIFRLLPRAGNLEPVRFRVRNLLTRPALIDLQRTRSNNCADAGEGIRSPPQPPPIVPRGAWDLSLAPPPLAPRQQIRGIIIHHDGIRHRATTSGEDKVRALRQSVSRFGWADVPFHYLIDTDGRIFEGAPEWAVTHTRTWHDPANLLHIAFLGDFSQEPPSEPQLQSLIDLAEWKATEHGLSPNQISLHSEIAATACPGLFVRERLNPPPWCRRTEPQPPLPVTKSG